MTLSRAGKDNRFLVLPLEHCHHEGHTHLWTHSQLGSVGRLFARPLELRCRGDFVGSLRLEP
jgi:hypothetical protein